MLVFLFLHETLSVFYYYILTILLGVDNDTTNLATSANLPRSSSTTRKSSVSLPEILQQTTLQEFLEVIGKSNIPS